MGLEKKKKVFTVSMDLEASEEARKLNPPKPKRKKGPAFDMKQALRILGGALGVAFLLWLIGWYDILSPPPPKYKFKDKGEQEAQEAQAKGQHAQIMQRLNERAP